MILLPFVWLGEYIVYLTHRKYNTRTYVLNDGQGRVFLNTKHTPRELEIPIPFREYLILRKEQKKQLDRFIYEASELTREQRRLFK